MKTPNELFERMRRQRQNLGLTQQQLATQAKVGIATVQNIEAGRGNPEVATLVNLLHVLGLEISCTEVKLDWNPLVISGLPLITGVKNFEQRAHRSFLMKALLDISKVLNRVEPNSREALALASFIGAIKEHFASVWADLEPNLMNWSKHAPQSIKLRRISVDFLASYL